MQFATFTAAEAEAITGVSAANQRNLRRHGYLLPHEGKWTRYSPEELCALMLLGQLSGIGVPPAAAAPTAWEHGAALVTFVLQKPGAVEGGKPGPSRIWAYDNSVGNFREAAAKLLDGRFLIVSQAHQAFRVDSVDAILNGATYLAEDLAALIVLDFNRLAEVIAERIGKPLLSFGE